MAVPADISDADMLAYIRDAIRAVTLGQEYKGAGGQYLKRATLAELLSAEKIFQQRVADAAPANNGGVAFVRFRNP